jgi:hypothetical protein
MEHVMPESLQCLCVVPNLFIVALFEPYHQIPMRENGEMLLFDKY